jgi:epoxyqueuosine reductase
VNGDDRERLRARLHSLGFDEVCFANANQPAGDGLRQWLAAGHHADMGWLERSAAKREDPQLVFGGTTSVIVLGVNYWPGHATDNSPIARYALHADYHDTIRAGLERAGRVLEEMAGLAATDYRYYVDAGPVQERGWASAAGIGFRGKNGNVISRTHGNWLLLAAILVRCEIPPDRPLNPTEAGRTGLLCGKCTRCLDACPTAAFPAPGVLDARRCISYHTIENRGFVPRELRASFGARVFGCDECLAVCPWNRFAQAGRSELLARRHDLARLSLLELLQLTPERFRDVFRGTAVKRTKLVGLLRNACIAAGNVYGAQQTTETTGRAAVETELMRLARHESAVVRGHAVWALRRIGGEQAATALLVDARVAESDAAVLAEYAAPAVTTRG